MSDTDFSVELKVRDYECDMQGIVNNAVYQNYLEHARHEFLHSKGLSFPDLTRRGIIVMVIRAELDYKQSLRAEDEFVVTVAAKQISRLKLAFEQRIIRKIDGVIMLEAQIIATSINDRNKPYFPDELKALL